MAVRIPTSSGEIAATMVLTGDAEPMACTFGVDGLVDTAIAQDAVDAFALLWSTEVMDVVSDQYKFTGAELHCRVPPDDETDPLRVFVSPSYATFGGNINSATPQNTAFLVHKRTAAAGRRNRGRTYLPGVGESSVSPTGALTGTILTDLPARFEAFRAGMASNGTPLTILHSAELAANAPLPTYISAFQLDPLVATQRRRLRR